MVIWEGAECGILNNNNNNEWLWNNPNGRCTDFTQVPNLQSKLWKKQNTHLTGTAIHYPQVLSKFFSNIKIHAEILEGSECVDFHGSCLRVMDDLFSGLQHTHDLPQSNINIWEKRGKDFVSHTYGGIFSTSDTAGGVNTHL